jgi:hypothetical protein
VGLSQASMSIPEVAFAVHHECARDKTLTKRREFS